MRRQFNKFFIFSFLFVYFEPLYCHGSESLSSLNSVKTADNIPNGGSRVYARYTAENRTLDREINTLINKYFRNVTATTKTTASNTLSPGQNTSLPPHLRIRKLPSSRALDDSIRESYYSTDVENYPNYTEIALKLKKFEGFLIKDVIPTPETGTHGLIDNDQEHYNFLCDFRKEKIKPREILNTKGEKVMVPNYQGQFEQEVVSEVCWAENRECHFNENFPNNLKSICKQNYIIRKMVTMKENQDPVYDDIPIPAGCLCVLKDTTLTDNV